MSLVVSNNKMNYWLFIGVINLFIINVISDTQSISEDESVLECVVNADWQCVQIKTVRALQFWVTGTSIEESNVGIENNQIDKGPLSKNSVDFKNVTKITIDGTRLPTLLEFVIDGISALLISDELDDRKSENEEKLDENNLKSFNSTSDVTEQSEGRNIYKRRRQLRRALAIVRSGITALFAGFMGLIQIKSLGVAIIGILLSVVSIFVQTELIGPKSSKPIKLYHLHSSYPVPAAPKYPPYSVVITRPSAPAVPSISTVKASPYNSYNPIYLSPQERIITVQNTQKA